MSPPPPHHTTFLLFILAITTTTTTTTATPTIILISELQNLQSQSSTGIIRLNDNHLNRILSLPLPRPFSLLIFFDAAHLHDDPQLKLPYYKSQFSILSTSFIHNNPNDTNKLFFFDIDYKDSQPSFSLFDVEVLPHILLVSPDLDDMSKSHKKGVDDYSIESMAKFVESKTQLTVGPLQYPPMFSGYQIAFFLIVLALWTPYLIKKVIAGQTLFHDYKTWVFGSVFVYFFSVSGAMYNIIRKMPWVMSGLNNPNQLVFFYQGSEMQLGVEGFVVGILYTTVGLLLAFVTHGVVKVRNSWFQRIAMALALIVSFWAVKKVVYLDNWKTGYSIHGYWPSSW